MHVRNGNEQRRGRTAGAEGTTVRTVTTTTARATAATKRTRKSELNTDPSSVHFLRHQPCPSGRHWMALDSPGF